MAVIKITIADEQLQYVLDRFGEAHGYRAELELDPTKPPVPNPETRLDFLRRTLVERIKAVVIEQDIENHVRALRATQTDVNVTAS